MLIFAAVGLGNPTERMCRCGRDTSRPYITKSYLIHDSLASAQDEKL